MIRALFIIGATTVACALLMLGPEVARFGYGLAGVALVLAVQEWRRPRHAAVVTPVADEVGR